jgi:signal transduction histidine kinase
MGVSLSAPDTPATVHADGDRLVMVMVNLLSNAVKYSPPGGTVLLAVAEAAGMVEVTVTDQGRGIAREHQRSIFDRFWQVHSSDDRSRTGSGLGLAICKTIVEHHGGAIGVNSAPDQGSTFWFRVPAEKRGLAGGAAT